MTTCLPALDERTGDVELLAMSAAGDDRGFALLHHRHAAACARRARHVLTCEEWVPDVLQAVFLDLWRQAGRYDPTRGPVRAWLLALTHHKAVDLVRSQQRHASRWADDAVLRERPDRAPTPEQQVTRADVARRVRAAVAGVPHHEREVLELCFLGGLTQREAAEHLSIPLGTVKTRSHRAVGQLRGVLDPGLLA